MLATDELKAEHEGITLMLRVLEEIVSQVESGREVDPEDIAQVIEFFKVFADACHHGKEEQLLFPALEEAGIPRLGGPVAVMLHEHDQGRRYVQQMALAALAGRNLPEFVHTGPNMLEFADAARNYVELLTNHIRKENEILFKMADQVLTPEKQGELRQAFEELERDLIGEGVHEALHAMMERMADKYL